MHCNCELAGRTSNSVKGCLVKCYLALLACLLLAGCDRTPRPTHTESNTSSGPQTGLLPVSGSLSILAWNVESGGNDPIAIASRLGEMRNHDVVCLNEVSPANFNRYSDALGSKFSSVESRTGRSDRLQILFDHERFELLQAAELDAYRDLELNNGTHRSPLFVRLRDRGFGVEFIVMTNHLARGNAELRRQQAAGLREWARDQSAGVINIGDFNMDYSFISGTGNAAFVEMLRDNVWKWIEPEVMIDTNWSDSDDDGMDNYPDSMLDFAFVSGPAKTWQPTCSVLVADGDFPDDESTSDHRPIMISLELPQGNR